jgi:PIN domain nuclease of toxin-antitoxin system
MTAHELARLVALGRLQFKMPIAAWLREVQSQLQFEWAPVQLAEAIESYCLPNFEHKDPCDRMLVATARISGRVLVTADDVLLGYSDVGSTDARE